MLLGVACLSMAIAAVIQRVTGLGFALVATPPMVLLYGPVEGVLTVVLLGMLASVVMLLSLLSAVDWRRSGWLIAAGVLVSPLAAFVALRLPGPGLLLLVGVAGVLSLAGSRLGLSRAAPRGVGGALAAGGLAGFMHVLSGLSGPPLIAYGIAERWAQRSFFASLQVVFIAYHVATLGWRGLPSSPPVELAVLSATVVVGVFAGALVARVVPAHWARRGMLALAWAGTIAVLIRGIWELL